ncbi:MAG: hypothetical protein GY762_05235 [Proteobacteria bacterium]|nr:hypothetical protein [Pseudomonadota bacterium]
MSTLGSLLVQDQIVGVKQIEQALQHQVIYGGYLATNLLELDLLAEDVLVEYAARVFGLPGMSWDRVTNADRAAIKAMPWTMVKKYDVLPIQLEDDKILVAVSEPLSDETLKELSFFVHYEFEQYFLLDFRLAMGLNRYYGISVTPRLKNLQQRFAPEFEIGKSPSTVPPNTVNSEIAINQDEVLVAMESSAEAREDETIQAYNLRSFDPKPKGAGSTKKRDTESTIQFYTQKQSKRRRSTSVAPPKKIPVQDNEKHDPFGMVSAGRSKPFIPLDLGAAAKQIQGAKNRDEIIELVAKLASQVFEYTLLLVVHGAFAQGRFAISGTRNEQDAEDISIPLDRGGMFETVFETRSFHLGPLGITEVEEEALQQMGRKWPKNCAILPVTLRNRVILMIYGDSGEKGVRGGQVSEFVRLTRHISEAFERILLAQKYKGYRAAAATVPPQPARTSYASKPPVSFESYRSASRGRSSESSPRSQAPSAVDGSQTKAPPAGKHLTDWAGRYHVQGEGHLADEGKARNSTKPPRSPRASSSPPGVRRSSGSPRRSYPTQSPLASRRGPGSVSYANMRDSQPVEPPEDFGEKIVHDVESGAPPPMFERRKGARDEAEKAAFARELRDIPISQAPAPFQARGRRSSSATTTEKPRSVMVEMKEEIDRLVARILSARRYDEEAADLLVGIGDDALKELIVHFPGPLLCDRYQESGSLPPVAEHGPLLKTLVKFDRKVVSHVLPLFESLDSDIRFYATFLFSELRYPEALGELTARIFDNDRQVRALAIEVIRKYSNYSEYNWSMRELISAFDSAHASLDIKRIAAAAIGDLGEPSAVGALIGALGANDTMLVDRCQKALVKITLADFGFSERRWEFWWDVHREQHRIEWAIEAITHGKAQIRSAAFQELVKYVGTAIDWPSADPNPRECQQLQDQLLEWWKREGRTLYPKRGEGQ